MTSSAGDAVTARTSSPHSLTLFLLLTGLFNRSISASGSVFTPWAFQEDPYYQAWTYARLFQCNTGSRNILRCLKERGAGELIGAAAASDYWFRPVVDLNITHSKALLKDFPRKLYERGEVARVPYLCGLTRNEGSLEYYVKYPELAQYVSSSQMREAIERMIRPFLRRYTNSKVISASIDYYYIQRVNHSSSPSASYGRQNYLPPNKNEKMIEVSRTSSRGERENGNCVTAFQLLTLFLFPLTGAFHSSPMIKT
jgi:carboxylesterase type B